MEKPGIKSPSMTARERILETAAKLFYRDGFHAVGVDTIVAQSGVAKMTLYRHFPSKDDLIVAYLERSNQEFWEWFEEAIAHADEPPEKLLALFNALDELAASPHCLGCTFQGTAAEFPALDHPGHQAALAHKQAVRTRLQELAEQAGLREPGVLADQLFLLMEGTWAVVRMYGKANPASSVAGTAATLIEAQRQVISNLTP